MIIVFRAVIEVLGKPQEHVDQSLQDYIQHLKESKQYKVVRTELAPSRQQEGLELWAAFAEVEVQATKLEDLTAFCFEYMPSLIEILEPKDLHFNYSQLSEFLNDLQIRLHEIDMIAKQVKTENDALRKNLGGLLKNYIQILLNNGNLDSAHLSSMTGVSKDTLEDFLDQLIDQGVIDMKEGIYFLQKRA